MAIQNDNTLVTKGDLKALYSDKIAPYLGANLALKTNVSDYYSTDEKIVGVWTDGKPLYQKTFIFSGVTNGKVIQLNIPNFEYLVSIQGTVHTGDNRVFDNGAVDISSGGFIRPQVYDGKIVLSISGFGSDWASGGGTYTIQYTKSTDAANSAVVTPGCYDINFPNTWPQNTEIYFGNGLYGQRFTGKITAAGSTWTSTTLLSAGTPAIHIVNWGGSYCYDTNSNAEIPVGTTWSNADNYNNGIDNMTINGNALVFGSISGGTRNNAPYNIWITYTK